MQALDYQFSSTALLELALTHSSYANEHGSDDFAYNERLEFLGDSVLGLVVSDYLYATYPQLPEGELSKVRALVVCEATLCQVAKALEVGDYLRLGKGESRSGGRARTSILADTTEAIIAALYLDGGIDVARSFVLSHFIDSIEQAVTGKLFKDYKSALQEAIQAKNNAVISYRIVDQTGPAHDRQFCAVALLDGKVLGKGCGKSKKNAEQEAAKFALKKLDDDMMPHHSIE